MSTFSQPGFIAENELFAWLAQISRTKSTSRGNTHSARRPPVEIFLEQNRPRRWSSLSLWSSCVTMETHKRRSSEKYTHSATQTVAACAVCYMYLCSGGGGGDEEIRLWRCPGIARGAKSWLAANALLHAELPANLAASISNKYSWRGSPHVCAVAH